MCVRPGGPKKALSAWPVQFLTSVPKMCAETKRNDPPQELAKMREPTPGVIRARIAGVKKEIPRLALAAQYLLATRASETVGRARAGEINYGIQVADMNREEYQEPAGMDENKKPVFVKHPAAIFRIGTAKRQGVPRMVPLSLEAIYEPWAVVFAQFFDEIGQGPVFDLDRQELAAEGSAAFAGLYYPIEPYTVDRGEGQDPIHVARHYREGATHILRHVRTTEYADRYGLDAEQRAQLTGWTPAGARIPAMIARYDMLNWRRVFPKFLVPSPYGIELARGRL